MFVSFLLPLVDRGAGPLFHWVMLAQMASFAPDEIIFLGDEEYFSESGLAAGETLNVAGLRFRCPDLEQFRMYRKLPLDRELLLQMYSGNKDHLSVFNAALTNVIPELEQALENGLKNLSTSDIECFLTWCNCPSLTTVATRHGIPVIHNELGPLRGPLYHDTVYFDFSGVNGGSTPSKWSNLDFIKSELAEVELLTPDFIRGLMVQDVARVETIPRPPDNYAVGVALQVEDDSNAVAYNHGWRALDMLYEAIRLTPPDHVLVRSHPGAHFPYRGGLGIRDDSSDSLEFLSKCERVWSINSSVLAEAALWNVPTRVFGDSPVRCFDALRVRNDRQSDEAQKLLFNAFFLGYLVPARLLFDKEYYRWRLARHRTLGDCVRRHADTRCGSGRSISALRTASLVESPAATSPIRLPAIWAKSTSLDARIAHLNNELQRVTADLERLTEERRSLRALIDDHLSRIAADISELPALIGAVQESVAGSASRLRDLSDLHSSQNLHRWNAFSNELREHEDRMVERVTSIEKERWNAFSGDLRERDGRTIEHVLAIEQRIAELSSTLLGPQSALAVIRASNDQLLEQVALLLDPVKRREEQVTSLQEQCHQLEARCAAAENRAANLDTELARLSNRRLSISERLRGKLNAASPDR